MSDSHPILPFNTSIAAASRDASARIESLRALHGDAPDEWLAVRLERYDDDAVTGALFKPDSLVVTELSIVGAETASGPGVVPFLMRHDFDTVDVIADGTHIRVTIVDL